MRKLYTGIIVSGLQAFSKIITFMVAQDKKLLTCHVFYVPKCNIRVQQI
jgi:hypothetical protein